MWWSRKPLGTGPCINSSVQHYMFGYVRIRVSDRDRDAEDLQVSARFDRVLASIREPVGLATPGFGSKRDLCLVAHVLICVQRVKHTAWPPHNGLAT
jgi:hypothetical protein